MKVLILGGTKFVGRTLAESALAAGHDLTLFNRGNTNADLFPDVEKLQGDRDNDLSALEGRKWDVVIDTCGYIPRAVKTSAELLKDSVEHYTFISSVSVYGPPIVPYADESAKTPVLDDPTIEEVTGETYGPLKRMCEQAAEEAMPGRVLNVRAGLIVGPYDPTDRFTYWPVNIARDEEALIPPGDSIIKVIDVRDLSEWIIRMAEARKAGIYNVTGPSEPLTYGEVADACVSAADNPATLVEASESFLLENGVNIWSDLPLWVATEQPEFHAIHTINVQKAIRDGLTYRPITQTVKDTLEWYKSERGLADPLRSGLAPERKAELLEKWKAMIG